MKDFTICLFLVLSFCASCLYSKGHSQVYQPNVLDNGQTEEIRDLKGFTQIKSNSVVDVVITQSTTFEVKVVGSASSIEKVITRCNGNCLQVDTKNGNNFGKLEVQVSLPNLEKLEVNGVGKVRTNGILSGQKLEIDHNGVGSIKLTYKGELLISELSGTGHQEVEFYGQQIDYKLSGVGEATVFGKTQNLKLSLSGTGQFKSQNLKVTDASVDISGVGSGEINVSNSVEGSLSGVGNLNLKGSPKKVNVSQTGVGKVKQE